MVYGMVYHRIIVRWFTFYYGRPIRSGGFGRNGGHGSIAQNEENTNMVFVCCDCVVFGRWLVWERKCGLGHVLYAVRIIMRENNTLAPSPSPG
jgi:hypothetical protein